MSAWVIGGTSGIGQAVTETLMREGIRVSATGVEVDVTSYEQLENHLNLMIDDSTDKDRLDTVIYCAGENELEWLGKMGSNGCSSQLGLFEVNAFGFIQVLDILVKHWGEGFLAKDQGLQVVAISSDAGERPMRTSIGYCASKAALNMAIRCAARELGPKGWKVMGVAPGMMTSGQMTDYIDARVPEVRGWTPEKTLEYELEQAVIKNPVRINPNDIASVVFDLIHMLAAVEHLNGSIITVNGGR